MKALNFKSFLNTHLFQLFFSGMTMGSYIAYVIVAGPLFRLAGHPEPARCRSGLIRDLPKQHYVVSEIIKNRIIALAM